MGAEVVLRASYCDISFILVSFLALPPTHSGITLVLIHFIAPPRRQSEINNIPFHHKSHALLFFWFCAFTHLALDLQGEFPVASRSAWIQFTVWELVFNPAHCELYSQKKKKKKSERRSHKTETKSLTSQVLSSGTTKLREWAAEKGWKGNVILPWP